MSIPQFARTRYDVASASSGRASGLTPGLVLATIATTVAGWLFKAHCVLDGAWDAGEQYTVGCYTDVVPFWSARGVADGLTPYLETALEYPVLAGGQIWLSGGLARVLGGSAVSFLGWVTLFNAVLAVAVLVALAALGVSRRRLWWWALAPPLVLYLGHNWDLLPILAVVAAIALHRRVRPGWAGVAVGIGTAAKLFPGLLLPLLVLTHLRRRDARGVVALVGGAAAAWLVANLPVAWVAPDAWAEFYTFSSERLGTYAATWTVLERTGVLATDVAQRNLAATAAFLVGGAAIVAAGWRSRRGLEWTLLLPLLAWFLLTNKVYSPQFDLWLVPVALLALRRLWPLAAFFVADALVYWAEFWWLADLAGFTPSASYPPLVAAAAFRAVVLLVFVVEGVRAPPDWLVSEADSDVGPARSSSDSEVVGADSR